MVGIASFILPREGEADDDKKNSCNDRTCGDDCPRDMVPATENEDHELSRKTWNIPGLILFLPHERSNYDAPTSED